MTGRLTADRASPWEEGAGGAAGNREAPRNLAPVTQSADRPHEPRRRATRLFGEAAEPSAPKPVRAVSEAPRSLRGAALVVGVEAALIGVGALVLLWLTLTGTPDSLARAIAEVVAIGAGAAVLAAAAVGLWRVSAWARGPVIVFQLLLAALGYTTAFDAGRPLIGLPALGLVAAVLYLLATPESRLAYVERSGSDD
jgi:hypothetical protein